VLEDWVDDKSIVEEVFVESRCSGNTRSPETPLTQQTAISPAASAQ